MIEIDLNHIAEQAKQRKDENSLFRTYLKKNFSDKTDKIVESIYKQVVAEIDCTQCGNCCNTLEPCIEQREIPPLAAALGIKTPDFEKVYTEKDETFGISTIKSPCVFLKDKKCMVYDNRPYDCVEFPNITTSDFIFRMYEMLENYGICPIVFNVVEKLKDEVNFER
jgi:Fe-S-cluster containining protein